MTALSLRQSWKPWSTAHLLACCSLLLICTVAPPVRGEPFLYVGSNGNNTIDQVSSSGVGSTFASGFSFPTRLAFGPNGNLFVSDTGNNTIDEVMPSGVVSTFASGGLVEPVGIALVPAAAAVPEPSSGLLLSLGGLILATFRWRRWLGNEAAAA